MVIAGVDSTGRLRSSPRISKMHTVDCSSKFIEIVQGFGGYRIADYQIEHVRQQPQAC